MAGLINGRVKGASFTKDAATTAQGHFTPRLKPELVVQIDAVKQMASQPSKSEVLLEFARRRIIAAKKGRIFRVR